MTANCSVWGICSQKCDEDSTTGQIKCSCFEGYVLEHDGYSCKPASKCRIELFVYSTDEGRWPKSLIKRFNRERTFYIHSPEELTIITPYSNPVFRDATSRQIC